jgi:hypothetical protein
MTAFRNKSEINKLAADKLAKEYLFAPTVNCLYYSCLQFTIHLLISKWGFTENNISSEISKSRGGSHSFYIGKSVALIAKKDKFAAINFRRSIGKLKILREDAEYKSAIIDANIHQSAEAYYHEIFSILKSHN